MRIPRAWPPGHLDDSLYGLSEKTETTHNVPVKLAMELGAGLAWWSATAEALHNYNRQRRDDHEQPQQWPAVPNHKVEQVRSQEYHRGKGHREIPNSAHFRLLLAVALLAMLDFYPMTVTGWAWFAVVGPWQLPKLVSYS